ncbi:hypothetical protein COO60DRAFT_938978 [Scenedesmus sp. NREL 46B-D3]|nr:hypothetical protein COO60DRAFT_938978 [Scenedesmus sp. NREL 46B-D3]
MSATFAGRQQQQQQEQQSELRGSLVVGIHHYSGSWMDWDLSSKQHTEQQLQQETSQHLLFFFRESPLFEGYNCSAPLQSSRSSSRLRHATQSPSGPIPLCMEFVLDALATGRCAVLSVLGQASGATAAAHDAGQDVSTELLLQRLGCDLLTASPSREPPAPLQALLSASEGTSSSSTGSSSTGSSGSSSSSPPGSSRGSVDNSSAAAAGAGNYHHIQVLQEQQAGWVGAAGDAEQAEAVPLLSLLQQDPWDLARQQQQQEDKQQEQQQQQVGEHQRQQGQDTQQENMQEQQEEQQEQGTHEPTAEASQQLQRRYVLRLSCGGCALAVLQQLFEQAGESGLLQRTELLLLDMQLPPEVPAASTAGTGEGVARQESLEGAMAGSAAGAADTGTAQHSTAATDTAAAAEGQRCAADVSSASSATAACSDEGSSGDASASSCEASRSCQIWSNHSSAGSLQGLAAVYNLLHQQHGFVGFMRQHHPCGVVRLGWVRQPSRMAARAAVLGGAADMQLLGQLGV